MGFELDASGLAETAQALDKAARETITEMAQLQIVQIRQRVAQGIGVNDAGMPPYAESTGKSGARNLTQTGSMLRSLHTEHVEKTSDGYEATIAFANQQDAAKAAYNQARAPWFGISPQDEVGLQQLAQAHIDEIKDAQR